MKLRAYTLIEGIVSMVILSTLLSVAILVSFNLYKSLPTYRAIQMQGVVSNQLDSLLAIGQRADVSFKNGNYNFHFVTKESPEFNNIRFAYLSAEDPLGKEVSAKRLFLSYE